MVKSESTVESLTSRHANPQVSFASIIELCAIMGGDRGGWQHWTNTGLENSGGGICGTVSGELAEIDVGALGWMDMQDPAAQHGKEESRTRSEE